jgi:hypothetical protein
MSREKIFVVNTQVATCNSKVNWPDMNYPGSGDTILRIVHEIDYDNNQIRLDGETGPLFSSKNFPEGVGFYTRCQ